MNVIDIKKGDQIAQIMFEQLVGIPETTYPNKIGASFNDEDIYCGLGKYQSEYEKSTEKYIKVKEDLDKQESAIYANILTMMGIFVSIFSMITINFSAINSANFNSELILTINLLLGIIITVFMGLIFIFLNKKNSKSYYWLFGIVVALLIAILVVAMYK